MIFEMDNLGVRSFVTTSTQYPYRLEANGDISNLGNAQLATQATSSVTIGGVTPVFKLNVDGIACAANFTTCSDARFKSSVTALSSSIETVSRLKGVNFYWRADQFPERHFTDDRQIGFIAQDVEKILPEAVHKGKDGYYTIDYGRFTPLLVEAIKEQQQTIDRLKARVQELESVQAQLTELEQAVRDLQARNGKPDRGDDELATVTQDNGR